MKMTQYKVKSIHYTSDTIHNKSDNAILFQKLSESIQASFDTIHQGQRAEQHI
jgi:hypothetical protein